MDLTFISQHPHLRFNPLLGEWVQVSPNRSDRPWQGQVETSPTGPAPHHDPNCYLCPGSTRVTALKNPHYENTWVFDNDFPALLASTPQAEWRDSELLIARTESGICRVVCFSPRHDLSLSQMKLNDVRRVVDVWVDEYRNLGENSRINYVLIFENRGAMMGASNPHPHCQIWATATIPNEPAKEIQSMLAYTEQHRECLLCTYLKLEIASKDRVVFENQEFVILVPFWAIWPFETLVVSKRHIGAIDELDEVGRTHLAGALKDITSRYDNLFQASFPYSMGFHQRPTDGKSHAECHLHAHFYPPLLRSATIRKFMVGFEMLGTPQRDILPETAAASLRHAGE